MQLTFRHPIRNPKHASDDTIAQLSQIFSVEGQAAADEYIQNYSQALQEKGNWVCEACA